MKVPAVGLRLRCAARRGLCLPAAAYKAWTGAQAERKRLVLGNEEAIAAVSGDLAQAGAVAALSVRGNFMFDPATHRDFLGALLGTGIERQKVLSAWQSHWSPSKCWLAHQMTLTLAHCLHGYC